MGFERVCAVMQGKASNYDSDVLSLISIGLAQRATDEIPRWVKKLKGEEFWTNNLWTK